MKSARAAIENLPKKQQTHIRRLASRMAKYDNGEVMLPISSGISDISLLYRGKKNSWFDEPDMNGTKLLIRLDELNEEGLCHHLNETAKIFQWVLWQPFLGENSKSNPHRCWREENFATPGEFLVSLINEKKQKKVRDICAQRWDTNMMMGGKEVTKKLINKNLKKKNALLIDSVKTWMRGLKWHQNWDWETLAEKTLFGDRVDSKFTVYWENNDYEIPKSFKVVTVWTKENRNVNANIGVVLQSLDVKSLPGGGQKTNSDINTVDAWKNLFDNSKTPSKRKKSPAKARTHSPVKRGVSKKRKRSRVSKSAEKDSKKWRKKRKSYPSSKHSKKNRSGSKGSPKRKNSPSPKKKSSPKRKASPKRKFSPKKKASPKRKASPKKKSRSPKHKGSPKRKASPKKKSRSPKRKASPKKKSKSPKKKSPKRKASPRKKASPKKKARKPSPKGKSKNTGKKQKGNHKKSKAKSRKSKSKRNA